MNNFKKYENILNQKITLKYFFYLYKYLNHLKII